MDFFGIAAGVRAAMEVYFSCSRRTGRTTRLVESLRAGDRVVCLSRQRAEEILNLSKHYRKYNVTCIVCSVSEINPRLFGFPGRTWLDHTWIEEFYANRMKEAAAEIARFEQRRR